MLDTLFGLDLGVNFSSGGSCELVSLATKLNVWFPYLQPQQDPHH
jgi:hypothetical protein